ncbi:MAG TPA: DUF4097 family beta strand repeat-containing protein [Ktedonobacterales bacterium]
MSDFVPGGGPPTGSYAREGPLREGAVRESQRTGPPLDVPYRPGQGYSGPPLQYPPRRRSPVGWVVGIVIALLALMLACGGVAAIVAAVAANSSPVSSTVDKLFGVSGVPTLIVRTAASNVHITPGGDGQIKMHAVKEVRGFPGVQTQGELDAIHVNTSQSGAVVTVAVTVDSGFWNAFSSRHVEVNLTTPAHSNLQIESNAGAFDATGVTGTLTAHVNAGSMRLSNMTLATGSLLQVNAGSLTLNGALQAGASLNVEVNAGSANVTLPRATSARVDATASAGSINVQGWDLTRSQNAATTTINGDLNPNPTGTITIHVSAGSVNLRAS